MPESYRMQMVANASWEASLPAYTAQARQRKRERERDRETERALDGERASWGTLPEKDKYKARRIRRQTKQFMQKEVRPRR